MYITYIICVYSKYCLCCFPFIITQDTNNVCYIHKQYLLYIQSYKQYLLHEKSYIYPLEIYQTSLLKSLFLTNCCATSETFVPELLLSYIM